MNVVKLGGNASREQLKELAALRPVVLVHGGGAQLTDLLQRLGVETRFHEGQRVTDHATLEAAEMVLAGKVNKDLAARLQALGIPAVGICGSDGGLLRSRITKPELGQVGLELEVDPTLLKTLSAAGYLPVVAPLAMTAEGDRLNVNADFAAAAIARALGAEKLVLLTDVDGVRRDGLTLANLTPAQAREMIAEGSAANGMQAKLEAALAAADGGVMVQIGSSLACGTVVGKHHGGHREHRGLQVDSTSAPSFEKNSKIESPPELSVSSVPSVVPPTSNLLGNYRRQPIAFTHGKGSTLYSTDGKEYLDFIGGIAVNTLGHAHPTLTKALQDQVGKLLHVSNLFTIPEQEELARQLCALSGMGRAFFCNSGTEANEAALKLARKHTGRARILTAVHSFHGRTMGALAATGNPDYHKGFEPLPQGFESLPYNDLASWTIDDTVAAVLLEPIQGEGGIIPGDPAFLQGIQELCRKHGALFMLDEVQTGVGRTGQTFCYQHYGLEPDVVTLAKGLGAGVPIGALLMKEELAEVLVPGTHGCTFGGNPLSCRAALTVLEALPQLLDNVRQRGEQLQQGLKARGYTNVRGLGLLLGADCPDAKAAEATCRERGVLVNAVRPTSLRFAPPLVVTKTEVETALEAIPACC